jgi:hypothetical protein
MYTINYTDGRKSECEDYDAALSAIASEYPDAEIGHDGDLTDGGDRTLCWANESGSINDARANAVASIELKSSDE